MTVFSDLPDDIVFAILNWLPFYDLLRFIAVDRLCRDLGMAHPTYWQFLELNTTTLAGDALEAAIRLYCLRIDRADARPVIIRFCGPDPRVVLRHLLPHFPHVHTLDLGGIDPVYSQEVISMLNTPAPQLQVLVLKFGSSGATSPPLIGDEIFQSNAPHLRNINLENVRIPTPAPAAFSNITTLRFGIAGGPIHQLPCLQASGLSRVQVCGHVSFAPEYFNSRVWRDVWWLDVLCLGAPPASNFPWDACRAVPRLSASGASLESCLAILDHVPGPLHLRAAISPCNRVASFEVCPFPEAGGVRPAPIWRTLAGIVPSSPADPNIPRHSAVYLAIFVRAGRIASLELAAAAWDRILMHLTDLPGLRDLRLLLDEGDNLASCSAVLDAPKLEKIRFSARHKHGLTRPISAIELKPFLDGTLLRIPKTRRILRDHNVSIVFPAQGTQPSGATATIRAPQ